MSYQDIGQVMMIGSVQCNEAQYSHGLTSASSGIQTWSQGYKSFFMLNSAEHEIFSGNKYENANNSSWHFHIYYQRKFHAQSCLARKIFAIVGNFSFTGRRNFMLS